MKSCLKVRQSAYIATVYLSTCATLSLKYFDTHFCLKWNCFDGPTLFFLLGGEKLLAFNVSVVKHYIPPMDVSSLGFSISTTHPLSPHSHPSLSQSHDQRLWQNLATVLSQLTEPLWTAPGIKSGHSVHKLTSTLKKKKRRWQGMNGWIF